MFCITHRFTKHFATTIAVVALGVPATSAAGVYEHGLGAEAAASDVQQEDQGGPDLRSPDATAAPQIGAQENAPGYRDLRSPDARASGQMAQSPEPVETVDNPPSFDWADAGIGAGSALGLLLVTLSVMFGVVHRRSRSVTT